MPPLELLFHLELCALCRRNYSLANRMSEIGNVKSHGIVVLHLLWHLKIEKLNGLILALSFV